MKTSRFVFLGLMAALSLSACKKVRVEPDLRGTAWVQDGGTGTFEFGKKDVFLNGTGIRKDGYTIYVEDGQIRGEKGSTVEYYFDYKLSGQNLFIAPEGTSTFFDPSSPSSAGIKYISQ